MVGGCRRAGRCKCQPMDLGRRGGFGGVGGATRIRPAEVREGQAPGPSSPGGRRGHPAETRSGSGRRRASCPPRPRGPPTPPPPCRRPLRSGGGKKRRTGRPGRAGSVEGDSGRDAVRSTIIGRSLLLVVGVVGVVGSAAMNVLRGGCDTGIRPTGGGVQGQTCPHADIPSRTPVRCQNGFSEQMFASASHQDYVHANRRWHAGVTRPTAEGPDGPGTQHQAQADPRLHLRVRSRTGICTSVREIADRSA